MKAFLYTINFLSAISVFTISALIMWIFTKLTLDGILFISGWIMFIYMALSINKIDEILGGTKEHERIRRN